RSRRAARSWGWVWTRPRVRPSWRVSSWRSPCCPRSLPPAGAALECLLRVCVSAERADIRGVRSDVPMRRMGGSREDEGAALVALNRWPHGERPREKLLASGPKALSDGELVAVLLGSGVAGKDAVM